jgi:hypothetical protein
MQNYIGKFSAELYAKLHMENLSTNLELGAIRIPVCVLCVGTLGGRGLQCFCCYVYDSVCHAEGFGLLLAMVCDLIATLTPCKHKHPLKLSAYINLTAVCAWSGMWSCRQPKLVSERIFLGETGESKLKGKAGTKTKFSSSGGYKGFSLDWWT